jgi:hypothetical protein
VIERATSCEGKIESEGEGEGPKRKERASEREREQREQSENILHDDFLELPPVLEHHLALLLREEFLEVVGQKAYLICAILPGILAGALDVISVLPPRYLLVYSAMFAPRIYVYHGM